MNTPETQPGGSLKPVGSASVASRAAKNEIENAINRLETVAARCRATMRGKEWTRREHDADIISLEVVPALRRAIWVMPNTKTQRRRATEQQMQTERATRRPL
jgi:hypothetical protein